MTAVDAAIKRLRSCDWLYLHSGICEPATCVLPCGRMPAHVDTTLAMILIGRHGSQGRHASLGILRG
jgi:hypothetical protein